MNHRLVSDTGASRLLLVFAGWGMDDNVLGHLRRPGYDVMVVWDYRSFHIDWSCVDRYDEICILAWSMGVYAAAQTTQAIEYKITRRVAVNGTPEPVHPTRGIPPEIFDATLASLSERSLAKFHRRMCLDEEARQHFAAHAPRRAADELADELRAISDRLILHVPSTTRWDIAIIGYHDRIFPRHAQMEAWKAAHCPFRVIDAGHYLDFQQIVDRWFIDKDTMSRRFSAGTATYSGNAVVQNEVVGKMMDVALNTLRDLPLHGFRGDILEIGSGSGNLSRLITRVAPDARLTLWDIAAPRPEGLPDKVAHRLCDAEMEISRLKNDSVDIIFSSSTIQWFNSPDRFIDQCFRVLRPGGAMVISTFTRGNLEQITALTGFALPLPDPDEWFRICTRMFDIAYMQAYERDLDFDSPADVLRHLKLTGVNSLGIYGPAATRSLLRRYPMMLDGRYHLTYRPMILILRK